MLNNIVSELFQLWPIAVFLVGYFFLADWRSKRRAKHFELKRQAERDRYDQEQAKQEEAAEAKFDRLLAASETNAGLFRETISELREIKEILKDRN